jgi:hypothetical protein
MEVLMEMKIADHEISKVCTDLDSTRYIALSEMKYGYGKLCCYTVKLLGDNEITTSYENICVALWLLFPKAKNFHLAGFDDMPDTDYMEKLVKLRSTLNDQGYLIGGNAGAKTHRPWKLTLKGSKLAEEAKNFLEGKSDIPTKGKSEQSSTKKGTMDYLKPFKDNKTNESLVFKKFENNESIEKIENSAICRSLGMIYSSSSFESDCKKQIKLLKQRITEAKKDGIESPELETYEQFLQWLDSQIKVKSNI